MEKLNKNYIGALELTLRLKFFSFIFSFMLIHVVMNEELIEEFRKCLFFLSCSCTNLGIYCFLINLCCKSSEPVLWTFTVSVSLGGMSTISYRPTIIFIQANEIEKIQYQYKQKIFFCLRSIFLEQK